MTDESWTAKLIGAMPWRGEHRREKRIERVELENERLKVENDALRREFKLARSLQEQMVRALENGPVVEGSRRGRVIGMLVIGGAACVVGMRLGRERLERAVAWVRYRLSRSGAPTVVTVPDLIEEREQDGVTRRASGASAP